MANLTLRSSTNQPLSFAELDGNFEYFTGSHAVTGSLTATQGFIGNVTGTASFATTASYALNGGGISNTSSLLTSSSFSDPNLLFTKGDGSTFNVNLSTLTVTNAANATFATTAGVATSAVIASSATTANTAATANTASYIQGANVDGDVTSAITSSYLNPLNQNIVITGSITASAGANFQTLTVGSSGTINGQNILTTANTSQFVTSVNGILPTAGNVAVSLTAVVTGTSASLASSGSGAITGSFSQGLLWVVSNDPTPANNGDVYIFTTSSGAGQWLPVAPLDTAAGDARYVKQSGNGAITGSFTVSGSGVNIQLLGNTFASVLTDASFLPSINLNQRKLTDNLGNLVLDYQSKNFYGTSATASYVNLVAGPNVTINQVGTSFEISGSAGGGGTPGGGGNSIQYNDGAGAFAGATAFAYIASNNSVNQGSSNVSVGDYSHVQGIQNSASILAQYSHAEGQQTITVGYASHAEGSQTISSGSFSHAEGRQTIARGIYSHAEGQGSTAHGPSSHAEGFQTIASGSYSHAEGSLNVARGNISHAEGQSTIALGAGSHAEGFSSLASGSYSHAEGQQTIAIGNYSHAEGNQSYTVGINSHAEGFKGNAGLRGWTTTGTTAGLVNISSIVGNIAAYFTQNDYVSINNSIQTVASSTFNGFNTQVQLVDTSLNLASGLVLASLNPFYLSTILPGVNASTGGTYAHAEGTSTIAFGNSSHAEGVTTIAYGNYSHAEGNSAQARGFASHAEGEATIAQGAHSHTEGHYTIANTDYQTVVGTSNLTSSVIGAFIIGNGTPYSYSYLQSNLLHAGGNTVEITGSLDVTGSLISRNTTILTQVSQSLNFVDDAAAAAGGVPLGGLYRNGSFIQIRIV